MASVCLRFQLPCSPFFVRICFEALGHSGGRRGRREGQGCEGNSLRSLALQMRYHRRNTRLQFPPNFGSQQMGDKTKLKPHLPSVLRVLLTPVTKRWAGNCPTENESRSKPPGDTDSWVTRQPHAPMSTRGGTRARPTHQQKADLRGPGEWSGWTPCQSSSAMRTQAAIMNKVASGGR